MSSVINKQEKGHSSMYETFDGVWRRILRDPYMGWTIILISAAIITILLVGVGYFTRLKVTEKLSSPRSVDVRSRQTLDKDELYTVLEVIQKRAVEHAAVAKNYSGPGDPAK